MIKNYGLPLKTVFTPRGLQNNTFFRKEVFVWSRTKQAWLPVAIHETLDASGVRNPQ